MCVRACFAKEKLEKAVEAKVLSVFERCLLQVSENATTGRVRYLLTKALSALTFVQVMTFAESDWRHLSLCSTLLRQATNAAILAYIALSELSDPLLHPLANCVCFSSTHVFFPSSWDCQSSTDLSKDALRRLVLSRCSESAISSRLCFSLRDIPSLWFLPFRSVVVRYCAPSSFVCT